MASTQGSGTYADPYTRWEGGIAEWSGLSGKYVAFGAYINMYPDSYDEMERYVVGVSGGGLSNPSYALRGTTSQSGTVSVRCQEFFGPDPGEYFDEWTFYFTVLSPPSYTVSVYSAGGGTVSGSGTYTQGSTATISATPSTGYHFTNWSDGDTNASRSFQVWGNVSLTAYFAINTYTVTVSSGGNGTVSGGGTYNYGASATLTATPASGYEFSQWSDGDTSNPRTVTVSGNATYTAQFVLGVATTNVKVNGSWVTGSVYVKVNGSWVASKKIYVKVNGEWVEGS